MNNQNNFHDRKLLLQQINITSLIQRATNAVTVIFEINYEGQENCNTAVSFLDFQFSFLICDYIIICRAINAVTATG